MNATTDPRAIVSLPASGPADLLFLLFHGLGAQAGQMEPLAQALRGQYPQAAIVSLNGPQAFDGIPGGGAGFQWFPASDRGDDDGAAPVAAALPDFIARIRAWAAHFGLEWGRVALAGFSQGAVMALEAVQAEPALAGRVIAVGGGYARAPAHAPADVCLHLLHGMDDAVLPYQGIVASAESLLHQGADITADVLPHVGHELHPQLVARALEQLRTFIPARLWREAMKAAPQD
jgi:phospholipase/carboxylesterase